MMQSGRPKTVPVQLKNGFYIEVCEPGSKKGMKIRSENQKSMELVVKMYSSYKEVIILGEYKDGIPVSKI